MNKTYINIFVIFLISTSMLFGQTYKPYTVHHNASPKTNGYQVFDSIKTQVLITDTLHGHSPIYVISPMYFKFPNMSDTSFVNFDFVNHTDTNATIWSDTSVADTVSDSVCISDTLWVWKKDSTLFANNPYPSTEFTNIDTVEGPIGFIGKSVYFTTCESGTTKVTCSGPDTVFLYNVIKPTCTVDGSTAIVGKLIDGKGWAWENFYIHNDSRWKADSINCIDITDSLFINYGNTKFLIGESKNH